MHFSDVHRCAWSESTVQATRRANKGPLSPTSIIIWKSHPTQMCPFLPPQHVYTWTGRRDVPPRVTSTHISTMSHGQDLSGSRGMPDWTAAEHLTGVSCALRPRRRLPVVVCSTLSTPSTASPSTACPYTRNPFYATSTIASLLVWCAES